MSVQSKNLAENLDYDILVCLNQALVSINWVSGRKNCNDCVNGVSWEPAFDGTPEDNPGYLLWDHCFVTGGWSANRPQYVGSVYDSSEIEYHYQNWLLHPVYQAKFFVREATLKLEKCKEELEKDWGKETFGQINDSFWLVLNLLISQQYKSHDYRNLPFGGIRKKGMCIHRCLFLKLKNLIKNLENLINNGAGPHLDILRVNHLNDVSPGLATYCKQHHLVKRD